MVSTGRTSKPSSPLSFPLPSSHSTANVDCAKCKPDHITHGKKTMVHMKLRPCVVGPHLSLHRPPMLCSLLLHAPTLLAFSFSFISFTQLFPAPRPRTMLFLCLEMFLLPLRPLNSRRSQRKCHLLEEVLFGPPLPATQTPQNFGWKSLACLWMSQSLV